MNNQLLLGIDLKQIVIYPSKLEKELKFNLKLNSYVNYLCKIKINTLFEKIPSNSYTFFPVL
jgi:hypothetical protein